MAHAASKIEATDREVLHTDRLAIGRAHFDAAGYRDGSRSPWVPSDREHFARAFAEITRPLGGR